MNEFCSYLKRSGCVTRQEIQSIFQLTNYSTKVVLKRLPLDIVDLALKNQFRIRTVWKKRNFLKKSSKKTLKSHLSVKSNFSKKYKRLHNRKLIKNIRNSKYNNKKTQEKKSVDNDGHWRNENVGNTRCINYDSTDENILMFGTEGNTSTPMGGKDYERVLKERGRSYDICRLLYEEKPATFRNNKADAINKIFNRIKPTSKRNVKRNSVNKIVSRSKKRITFMSDTSDEDLPVISRRRNISIESNSSVEDIPVTSRRNNVCVISDSSDDDLHIPAKRNGPYVISDTSDEDESVSRENTTEQKYWNNSVFEEATVRRQFMKGASQSNTTNWEVKESDSYHDAGTSTTFSCYNDLESEENAKGINQSLYNTHHNEFVESRVMELIKSERNRHEHSSVEIANSNSTPTKTDINGIQYELVQICIPSEGDNPHNEPRYIFVPINTNPNECNPNVDYNEFQNESVKSAPCMPYPPGISVSEQDDALSDITIPYHEQEYFENGLSDSDNSPTYEPEYPHIPVFDKDNHNPMVTIPQHNILTDDNRFSCESHLGINSDNHSQKHEINSESENDQEYRSIDGSKSPLKEHSSIPVPNTSENRTKHEGLCYEQCREDDLDPIDEQHTQREIKSEAKDNIDNTVIAGNIVSNSDISDGEECLSEDDKDFSSKLEGVGVCLQSLRKRMDNGYTNHNEDMRSTYQKNNLWSNNVSEPYWKRKQVVSYENVSDLDALPNNFASRRDRFIHKKFVRPRNGKFYQTNYKHRRYLPNANYVQPMNQWRKHIHTENHSYNNDKSVRVLDIIKSWEPLKNLTKALKSLKSSMGNDENVEFSNGFDHVTTSSIDVAERKSLSRNFYVKHHYKSEPKYDEHFMDEEYSNIKSEFDNEDDRGDLRRRGNRYDDGACGIEYFDGSEQCNNNKITSFNKETYSEWNDNYSRYKCDKYIYLKEGKVKRIELQERNEYFHRNVIRTTSENRRNRSLSPSLSNSRSPQPYYSSPLCSSREMSPYSNGTPPHMHMPRHMSPDSYIHVKPQHRSRESYKQSYRSITPPLKSRELLQDHRSITPPINSRELYSRSHRSITPPPKSRKTSSLFHRNMKPLHKSREISPLPHGSTKPSQKSREISPRPHTSTEQPRRSRDESSQSHRSARPHQIPRDIIPKSYKSSTPQSKTRRQSHHSHRHTTPYKSREISHHNHRDATSPLKSREISHTSIRNISPPVKQRKISHYSYRKTTPPHKSKEKAHHSYRNTTPPRSSRKSHHS